MRRGPGEVRAAWRKVMRGSAASPATPRCSEQRRWAPRVGRSEVGELNRARGLRRQELEKLDVDGPQGGALRREGEDDQCPHGVGPRQQRNGRDRIAAWQVTGAAGSGDLALACL